MKAVLLKDARVALKAGEVVNISPADYAFLVSLGVAAPLVEDEKEAPKKKTAKK